MGIPEISVRRGHMRKDLRKELSRRREANAKAPRREPAWTIQETVRGLRGWSGGRTGEVEGAADRHVMGADQAGP